MLPLRATFLMEQHLGHQTYYQNLRRHIDHVPGLSASWVPITYFRDDGLLERVAALPKGLRGTLRGTLEARAGMKAPADVIFFNTQVPAALGASAIGRRPYLIATDITPIQYDAISTLYGHQPDKPGLLKAYKHRVNRRIFRNAYKLLPWSSWARDSLVQDYGVEGHKVEVLAPGVDLSLLRPGPEKGSSPAKILFVGGDFERKGGQKLLLAFRLLPAGSAELHLVTRSQLPSEPGVVIHNGISPNSPGLIELYRRADIFVLPTEAEAFGIAAIEACAAGLPIIANRTGGLVDIVQNGANGFLLQRGDQNALLECLRELTTRPDLRQQMGRASREFAEARFDAVANARRVAQLLDDAVGAT